VDYKREDTAITKEDGFVVTRRGKKQPRKTTQGWKLLVRWADGAETWIPLKDMKESHPVETASECPLRTVDAEQPDTSLYPS